MTPLFYPFFCPHTRCGHCKSLAPIYEKLARAYAGDSKSIVIGKVDATEEQQLASKYNIQGFPTVRFFPADLSEPYPEPYEGPRELDAMVHFVNEHTGLSRTVEGKLLPTAGRVTRLDEVGGAAVMGVSVWCCAVLRCAVACCAVLCCAVLRCSVLRCAVVCCAVLCCAVLRCAVLYCRLCCAVFCCGVLYLATLCRVLHWSTMLLHRSAVWPRCA